MKPAKSIGGPAERSSGGVTSGLVNYTGQPDWPVYWSTYKIYRVAHARFSLGHRWILLGGSLYSASGAIRTYVYKGLAITSPHPHSSNVHPLRYRPHCSLLFAYHGGLYDAQSERTPHELEQILNRHVLWTPRRDQRQTHRFRPSHQWGLRQSDLRGFGGTQTVYAYLGQTKVFGAGMDVTVLGENAALCETAGADASSCLGPNRMNEINR